MDVANLKRMVQAHEAFSGAFNEHLCRLWGREPSSNEADTFQSFTLCASLMTLESVERSLVLATVVEKADECFSFMELQVQKHSGNAVREVRRRMALDNSGPMR